MHKDGPRTVEIITVDVKVASPIPLAGVPSVANGLLGVVGIDGPGRNVAVAHYVETDIVDAVAAIKAKTPFLAGLETIGPTRIVAIIDVATQTKGRLSSTVRRIF